MACGSIKHQVLRELKIDMVLPLVLPQIQDKKRNSTARNHFSLLVIPRQFVVGIFKIKMQRKCLSAVYFKTLSLFIVKPIHFIQWYTVLGFHLKCNSIQIGEKNCCAKDCVIVSIAYSGYFGFGPSVWFGCSLLFNTYWDLHPVHNTSRHS